MNQDRHIHLPRKSGYGVPTVRERRGTALQGRVDHYCGLEVWIIVLSPASAGVLVRSRSCNSTTVPDNRQQ